MISNPVAIFSILSIPGYGEKKFLVPIIVESELGPFLKSMRNIHERIAQLVLDENLFIR